MNKQVALYLYTGTRKLARLYAAIVGTDEGGVIVAGIGAGCRDFLADADTETRDEILGIMAAASQEETNALADGWTPRPADGAKRQTSYRMLTETALRLRECAKAAGTSNSAFADAAIRRHILRLVSRWPREEGDTFLAALKIMRWPEDE